MKNLFNTTLLLLTVAMFACLFGQNTYAASAAEVKARMKERLPAITALKNQGIIGENNKGFLELRQKSDKAATLVQQENADRGIAYSAIAQKQGGSVEAVGKSGARSIEERGAKGHWFQSPDGKWYQK